jgi:small subunit ribosomal protein S7
MEVKSKRVGGATYQVPVPVTKDRRFSLATRWIVDASKAKKGKPMEEKLADELLNAAANTGVAVKKKEDVHRMAEANKAFAHFAW